MRRSANRRQHLPEFDALESRLVPAVSFNQATGHLSVVGDEAGHFDDVIVAGLGEGGFVEVTINGTLHSSDAGSADFDVSLTGATATTVLSIHLDGLTGSDTITLEEGFTAADGQITLEGGAGADFLTGSSLDETLSGRTGSDTLNGGGGDDSLRGGRADDELHGEAGNDSLRGGDGDDNLQGGDDVDTVVQIVDADMALTDTSLTGKGDDTLGGIERGHLTGGARDNRIDAAAFTIGGLAILGRAGDDTVIGGADDDQLFGGDGDDSVLGGGGNDLSVNEGGSDTLVGEDGEDRLIGGPAGIDSLLGGEGNDTLVSGGHCEGGFGDSTLVGDLGNDQFTVVEGREFQIVDLSDGDTVTEAMRICPS